MILPLKFHEYCATKSIIFSNFWPILSYIELREEACRNVFLFAFELYIYHRQEMTRVKNLVCYTNTF